MPLDTMVPIHCILVETSVFPSSQMIAFNLFWAFPLVH